MLYRQDRVALTNRDKYWSDAIYDYLAPFMSNTETGISHESGDPYIWFEEPNGTTWAFKLVSNIDGTGPNFYTVIYDGYEITQEVSFGSAQYLLENMTFTFTLALDTNFLYLSILRPSSSKETATLIKFYGEDGKVYAGGAMSGDGNQNARMIHNCVVYDTADQSGTPAPYYNARTITYSAPPGEIGYSNKVPFTANGVYAFMAAGSNIKSCSNVSYGNVISLPNSHNYIALGTNFMVELDPT